MIVLPQYYEFFLPVLESLKQLGGSGSNQEIYDQVCALKNLSEEQQSILHNQGPQTEIYYRIGWAKTYLKKCQFIENTSRSIWALTEKGLEIKPEEVDEKEIINYSRKHLKNLKKIIRQRKI